MIANTSTAKETDEARKNSRIWLIVSQIIVVLGLLPWFALLAFASMIGWPDRIEDQGWDLGSSVFSTMLCYPFFAITSIIIAWVLYAKGNYRWASIATSIPMLFACLSSVLFSFT